MNGLPDGKGLNIAFEAVDRHASGPLSKHVAIRWLGKSGEIRDYTFADLRNLSNRFANVLQRLGVTRGERVYVLAGRTPELYIEALGTLKNRSVFCPLFSAFGPEPIRSRMTIGQAKVLVTTGSLYERKVAALRESLPNLKHVILIGADRTHLDGTLDFQRLMDESSDDFTIGPTDPEDIALLHFTSGTTGTPKGAVHVHEAVVAHHITGKLALDLHPDDVFWCTADPLVAPALLGTDKQNLDELMKNFRDLVKRARAGSLRSSELSEPTITVTSLGERGAESVFGIIYPPQVAIIGFGRPMEWPRTLDGQIVLRPAIKATLSADHRVSDGHRGSLFLAAVDRLLQEPGKL